MACSWLAVQRLPNTTNPCGKPSRTCFAQACHLPTATKDLQISSTWVSELRKLIQTFGTATPPHPSVQGRPRKIHTEAEEGILDFLDDNPTAYLDEIQDFLLTEYQITASVPTVSRCVKKLKLTHKKTTRTNTAQDDALRARYFSRIVGVPANRIVVVDESAANERTLDRRWGWSL